MTTTTTDKMPRDPWQTWSWRLALGINVASLILTAVSVSLGNVSFDRLIVPSATIFALAIVRAFSLAGQRAMWQRERYTKAQADVAEKTAQIMQTASAVQITAERTEHGTVN